MNEALQTQATGERINPITLEVVTEAMIAIVREMRATVIRSSYSSVIFEFDDFSCALFDAAGNMVAQSWDHPGHVLPLPWGVRCTLEDYKGDINPGDVFLLNDPYRGGTHLNDVAVIYPVFDEHGKLILFPAVRAHWPDVGGMVPGSYSGLSTNVYQEGVRIPPIKIVEGGIENRSALTLLMTNMRVPEEREGDLRAAIGACKVAEVRIAKLYKKYGAAVVNDCVALQLDRTERRLREKIAPLPDGDYYYEDYLEYFDDGIFDPVLVRFKLTVKGDQLIADFAGSNPQVPGVVNSSLAVAGAGVFVAIKATLDPGGAVNEGAFRPIELRAPEGSVVNVRLDAPAGAHGEVRKRGVSVALGALSQIIPDLVSGDLCGSSFPNNFGGFNKKRNRHFIYLEAPAGGNGGLLGQDGPSAMVNVDFGNLPSIQNAEVTESEMPVLVEGAWLRTDSGGEGAGRGGLGMRRQVRLLDGEASYSVLSDRAVIPPYGVFGGRSGAPYRVSVLTGNQEHMFNTPGKVTGHPMGKGEVLVMQSSGGGGYGDPLERDPQKVRADLLAGYISGDRANNGYGVQFRADGEVDVEATRKRRAELQKARKSFRILADSELAPYEGRRGWHRMVDMSEDMAKSLGAAPGQLVELLGRHPAPLRGWVRIRKGHPADTLKMDDFGMKVLGLRTGDSIEVRVVESPVPAAVMASNPAKPAPPS
ncbi:MAG: hydantoinase B/oxoprolinase family protein [Reyranellaceae bacterium]